MKKLKYKIFIISILSTSLFLGNIYLFFIGSNHVTNPIEESYQSGEDNIEEYSIQNSGFYYAEKWNKTWGCATIDYGKDVALDTLGNAYITGFTDGNGAVSYDICLVKYNSTGDYQWNITWGYSSVDRGNAIAIDSQNNIYITGESSIGGTWDMVLVKFNSSGDQIWNQTWSTTRWDTGSGIAIDSSDNIYVIGKTEVWEASDGWWANDFLLVKYNNLGSKQWEKTWGGKYHDSGRALALDSEENIYITGTTESYGAGVGTFPNVAYVKYDQAGNYQWYKVWGTASSESGMDIKIDSNNNTYIIGYDNSGGNNDFALLKYNTSGDFDWDVSWGASGHDYGYGIELDTNENIFVIGKTYSYGAGGDSVLIQFSNTGDLVDYWLWGGNNADEGFGIYIDASNNIFLAGTTQSYGPGSYNIFLLKYELEPIITEPVLSNMTVTPISGYSDENFTFSVTMTSLNNTAPDSAIIVLDGITHDLEKANPLDMNYSDGVDYYYNASLTSGLHSGYFIFEQSGYIAFGPNNAPVEKLSVNVYDPKNTTFYQDQLCGLIDTLTDKVVESFEFATMRFASLMHEIYKLKQEMSGAEFNEVLDAVSSTINMLTGGVTIEASIASLLAGGGTVSTVAAAFAGALISVGFDIYSRIDLAQQESSITKEGWLKVLERTRNILDSNFDNIDEFSTPINSFNFLKSNLSFGENDELSYEDKKNWFYSLSDEIKLKIEAPGVDVKLTSSRFDLYSEVLLDYIDQLNGAMELMDPAEMSIIKPELLDDQYSREILPIGSIGISEKWYIDSVSQYKSWKELSTVVSWGTMAGQVILFGVAATTAPSVLGVVLSAGISIGLSAINSFVESYQINAKKTLFATMASIPCNYENTISGLEQVLFSLNWFFNQEFIEQPIPLVDQYQASVSIISYPGYDEGEIQITNSGNDCRFSLIGKRIKFTSSIISGGYRVFEPTYYDFSETNIINGNSQNFTLPPDIIDGFFETSSYNSYYIIYAGPIPIWRRSFCGETLINTTLAPNSFIEIENYIVNRSTLLLLESDPGDVIFRVYNSTGNYTGWNNENNTFETQIINSSGALGNPSYILLENVNQTYSISINTGINADNYSIRLQALYINESSTPRLILSSEEIILNYSRDYNFTSNETIKMNLREFNFGGEISNLQLNTINLLSSNGSVLGLTSNISTPFTLSSGSTFPFEIYVNLTKIVENLTYTGYVIASNGTLSTNCTIRVIWHNRSRMQDSDSDGLSDIYEITLGTDFLNNDTDNDGLLDGQDNFPLDHRPNIPIKDIIQYKENGIVIIWFNATDLDGYCILYEIEISAVSYFTNETQLALYGLDPGIYYWRIRAQDNVGGWSQWSTTYSFTIESEIENPSDNNPPDNALFLFLIVCFGTAIGVGSISIILWKKKER